MIKPIYLTGALLLAGLPLAAQKAENHYVTPSYDSSNVQAQIRLNLDRDDQAVHFIRDNTDPYVITKTYVLKNADAYEVLPYLRSIVQANQITADNTTVEAAKLNDGTSLLLVSAEEDRFGAQPNGVGLDELVASLDKPNIAAWSGSVRFFYFPQYRKASELLDLVYNVGMTRQGDATELQQGVDKAGYEPGVNALLFYVPQFSKKSIEAMLKQYDQPLPQVRVKYTVYEIYDENDGKLGVDFQSWKNNDGADLFSVGGRYRSNWTSTWSGGLNPGSGSNKTQYFNFNPKWNSRYLDFVVSKGGGKVVNSGEVVVRNNESAVIDVNTNLFNYELTPIGDQNLTATATVSGTIYSSVNPAGNYYFTAADGSGNAITLSGGSISGSLSAIKITPPNNTSDTRYQLAITGGTLVRNGENLGTSTDDVTSFKLYQRVTNANSTNTSFWYTWTEVPFTDDVNIAKGNRVETVASATGYGFKLTVSPQVNTTASTLKVNIVNTSLVGWDSDGKPRVAKDSEVNSEVQVDNRGNRFIIGGIDKRELVRGVAGIPYLREIPGLAWIFGTESESTKHSQLILVGEVYKTGVATPVEPERKQFAAANDKKLAAAGKSNSWGFGQYGIDADKTTVTKGKSNNE